MLDFLKKLFSFSSNDLLPEDLENGTIVDVRTPAEFRQGHASGSINIPLQEIDRSLPQFRKLSQPIITCCRSGNRSNMAAQKLNASGIKAINGGTWQNVNRQIKG